MAEDEMDVLQMELNRVRVIADLLSSVGDDIEAGTVREAGYLIMSHLEKAGEIVENGEGVTFSSSV